MKYIDKYGHHFENEEEVRAYAVKFFYAKKEIFIQKVAETYSKEELATKLFKCYLKFESLEQIYFHSHGIVKEATENFKEEYLNNYCKKILDK